jgi:CBS domain-containing protein
VVERRSKKLRRQEKEECFIKKYKKEKIKMLVRDVMTKNVQLTSPDDTIRVVAQKMRDGDFGSLPVGKDDRIVGVITDRDIAVRLAAEGKDPNTTKVRDVMTERAFYCYEDQTVDDVAKNMAENQVRRFPVLNRQKRLVGILSLGDIATARGTEEHAQEALSGISRPGQNERRGSSSQPQQSAAV